MLIDDPRQANLKLTKLDNPDPVRIGSILTYTLKVENHGPVAARPASPSETTCPDNVQLPLREHHRGDPARVSAPR